MQLLVDPGIQTHGANTLNITGTSAESQPIECMNYLLVGRKLSMIEALLGRYGRYSGNQRERERGYKETSHLELGMGHSGRRPDAPAVKPPSPWSNPETGLPCQIV